MQSGELPLGWGGVGWGEPSMWGLWWPRWPWWCPQDLAPWLVAALTVGGAQRRARLKRQEAPGAVPGLASPSDPAVVSGWTGGAA